MQKRSYTKWTDAKLRTIAASFDTPSAFHEAEPTAYMAAKRREIFDSITAHMGNGRIQWTREKIEIEAAKYETRTAFSKGSRGAYSAAARAKILDEVCAHMSRYAGKGQKRGPNKRTTAKKSMSELMGL